MSEFNIVGSTKKNNFFEGWYYKNVTVDKKITISIIPGYAINGIDKSAFVQVITNLDNKSYYIKYAIDELKFLTDPTCLQIGNNYFYEDYISLDINSSDLKLKGNLYYSELTKLKKTIYAPTIMGPFAYLPFMECNHHIISMHHYIDGIININDTIIDFEDGLGYIEKDYGTSFPSSYEWLQSNTLKKDNLLYKKASIFFSSAAIPFNFLTFKGFIAVLVINDNEYRFTTYNLARLYRSNQKTGSHKIVLKRHNYKLIIRIKPDIYNSLMAPTIGSMIDTTDESLNSICHVTLMKREKVLFKQKFISCGYEKKSL